jgi:hypothetical protein
MMNEMMPGMMWGMGLVWSLVVIVLILAAAALIKYLRTESREGRQWTSSSSQHCRQSPCFLLAFLKEATKPGAAPQQNAQAQMGGKSGMMGGMGGMMGGGGDSNLKNLDPARRVKAITYRHDSYRVTTSNGKTRHFWERNLHFVTDSSKDGPESGAPAIMPAGMLGDRAAVMFAVPEEITKMIEARC